MDGILFNIQRFCTSDGPGIRTTVFLKGCPLHCIWCHNPESHNIYSELLFSEQLCIGCGVCAHVCANHSLLNGKHHIDRKKCIRCFQCADDCPSGALTIIGKKYTVDEVLAEVCKDAQFYSDSGGGVTLSGGEPLAQPQFTLELLKSFKEKHFHICMETCGYAAWKHIETMLPYTDLFLFDIKETNDEKHTRYTGVSIALIHENLRKLSEAGAKIILRCPIIPGLNDREDHFSQIGKIAEETSGVDHIEVEPYHPLGISKAEKIGAVMAYTNTAIPKPEEISGWIQSISGYTSKTVRQA